MTYRKVYAVIFSLLSCCLMISAVVLPIGAQTIISAVGGMVYHVEGEIFINDKAVTFDPARRPQMKKSETLRTEEGRAEIMVVHDGFMRLAPHSIVELISAGHGSAQVKLHEGTVIVELVEVWDRDSVAAFIGDHKIKFHKGGLYRLEAGGDTPSMVKVFKGKASVVINDNEKTIKSKREMNLGDGSYVAVKFDPKAKGTDDFQKWHQLRAGIINTQREEAMAAARRGEGGEAADQLLLKQGSAMWGCRQAGIGCGMGGGGGNLGGASSGGFGGGGAARMPTAGGGAGAAAGGGGGRR